MLRTGLCDLLGIELPIIQAGMGVFTSAELVAAVSNAGGLGSLGTGLRPVESLSWKNINSGNYMKPDGPRPAVSLGEELPRIRELTDRPFAVNYTLSQVNEEIFTTILAAKPPLISFALSDPGDFVMRAHAVGSLVMHQVTTVQQAEQAAARGVDIIVAQGSEAGGFGGKVAAMVLIPQAVAAVRPIPVVAAGGIADGLGLAAALVLGAQGVNLGTRFLASLEAPISNNWKQVIISAKSEDAIKVEVWNKIFPWNPLAYETVPRAIHTPFIEKWQEHGEITEQEAKVLRGEVIAAIQQGRMEEFIPWAGQTVGLVHEVLPAAEIVRRIAAEAEEALKSIKAKYLDV
ncbi:MAG TPA: nitronate monooxygenase family protein [Desulfitobacteriaceae bacterium]|nr:nitronate monooxygenase family protein [Desulfitobacteriaceae bacterium]